MHYLETKRGWLAIWMTKGVEKCSVEIPFLPKICYNFNIVFLSILTMTKVRPTCVG